jgi:hypothetical protein
MNTRSSALAGALVSCKSAVARLVPFRFGNGLPLSFRISLIEAFLYWGASYLFRMFCMLTPGPGIQRWDGFSCPKAIWWPPGPFSEPVEGQKEKATENPVRLMAYSFPSRR